MTPNLGRQGFTIVELMAATAITTLLAASLFFVFAATQSEMVQQDSYYESNRSARMALERIALDAKEAVRLEPTRGAYTTSGTVLIMRLPSIDGSGNASNISASFDYVTYRLSGTTLVRDLDVLAGTSREGGTDQTARVIAKNVQSLAFTSGSASLSTYSSQALPGLKYVNVAINAQRTMRGKTQTSQLDCDFMLRNVP